MIKNQNPITKEMKEITKRYSNGEVTVIWQPHKCIHSMLCFKGLPQVFDPNKRPWVTTEGASTQKIIEQVDQCPSGALSYIKDSAESGTIKSASVKVVIMPKGPLLVHGEILVKDKDGNEQLKEKVTAFCRCGQSSNKPYCDGTHSKVDFED